MATGPTTRDTSTIALGLAQVRVGLSAANISAATPVLSANHSIGALDSTKFNSAVDYWTLESGFPATTDMKIPLKEEVTFECVFKEITPFNIAMARGIDPNAVGAGFGATVPAVVKSAAGTVNTTLTNNYSAKITTFGAGAIVDTFTVTFTSSTAYTVTAMSGATVGGTGAIGSDSAFTIGGSAGFTITSGTFGGTLAAGDVFRFSVVKTGYGNNHVGTINLGTMKAPEYVRMEAVYTFPNGTNTMTIIFPRANVSSSAEINFAKSDNAMPTITFTGNKADATVVGGSSVWDACPLGIVLFG